MTMRQTKPRMLSEYELWSQSQAFKKAWDSDWIEGKIRLALRQGGVCGFCGYTPEKQVEGIRGKTLRRLTKRELLLRHMRNHLNCEYDRDRQWKHPPRFEHQGRL